MKYILIRDVTKAECSWLNRNFNKGEIVYYYNEYTYGLISPFGLPFTIKENELPFFELPKDSVEKV